MPCHPQIELWTVERYPRPFYVACLESWKVFFASVGVCQNFKFSIPSCQSQHYQVEIPSVKQKYFLNYSPQKMKKKYIYIPGT